MSYEYDSKKITEAEYKYDAANRLICYNGKEVQYDKDGNMTYEPLDGEMAQFEYAGTTTGLR